MELQRAGELAAEGLLTPRQLEAISARYRNRLFSLHWELRTILYLGVLLFAGGIGLLVYRNIDTIGHQAIMAFIALLCAGSFYYVFKHSEPYTPEEVVGVRPLSDYILLLGALLFATLETYIQYQYGIFGNRYNLATLLPVPLFFYLAYRFDHKGILSMAITGLAGGVGLTVTPLDLLKSNDFSSARILITGILFGLVSGGAAVFLYSRNTRKHFTFTYLNFALHMALASSLSGMFFLNMGLIYLVPTLFFLWAGYRYALHEKSLYFLLVAVLYAYIALTYLVFRLLFLLGDSSGDAWIALLYIGLVYLAGSSFGVVSLFRNYRKILRIVE